MSTPTADQVAIALVTACEALGARKEVALDIAAGGKDPIGGDFSLSRARAYAVVALVTALGVQPTVAARLCGVSRPSQQTYFWGKTGKYTPKWWDDNILNLVKTALLVEGIRLAPRQNNRAPGRDWWPSLNELAQIKPHNLGRNVTAEVMGDPPPGRRF